MIKKGFLLLLLLMVFHHCSIGQPWRQVSYQTGPIEGFIDVEYATDQTIYVTGSVCGITCTPSMRKSTDGGQSWSTFWSGIPHFQLYQYSEVEFPSPDEGFFLAVTWDSTFIYKTNTGGLSWSPVYASAVGTVVTNYGWTGGGGKLHFYDGQNGFLIGNWEHILRTQDGGATWTNHSVPSGIQLLGIQFVDSQHGYTVGIDTTSGTDGVLYETTDGGDSWNLRYTQQGKALTSVQFMGQVGYISGKDILKTTDGGASWTTSLHIPGIGYFSEVEFSSLTKGTAVGPDSNRFFRTLDGGNNWISQSTTPVSLTSVNFFDDVNGGVVGPGGNFFLTDVGGVQCTTACVWPGDANHDMIVNNLDILQLGLGYGASGGARTHSSLDWTGQSAPDWSQTFPTGYNYKYADCNGDGLINDQDTSAIHENYSQTHNKGGGTEKNTAGAPQLFIDFPDTLTNIDDDTLMIPIFLGTAANPATEIYGIAFTLSYSWVYSDTHKAVVRFLPSFLADPDSSICFSHDLEWPKEVDAAVTRINGEQRDGYGQIATGIVVIIDNIDGINPLQSPSFTAWIDNVNLIDNKGDELAVNTAMDSTVLFRNSTTSREALAQQVNPKLYPNPGQHGFQVVLPQMEMIEVLDLQGQLIEKKYPLAGNGTAFVPMEGRTSGIYLIRTTTRDGRQYLQKWVKQAN